jgi:cyclic beta-1,2-glucan synthetase
VKYAGWFKAKNMGSHLPAWVTETSPQLLEILGSGKGPALAPIRSEIFGQERFAQHGRSLADTHQGATVHPGSPTFSPRLHDNIAALRSAHRYIGQQASTGYDISPAAEWLLDNFHLIEAQLEEIRAGLPRRYFHALPVLQGEPLAGLPRVYGVAWAFVAHTDSAFDENLLLNFLAAYQERCELNLGELWALPTTLRVVLVENLRRLAERVATNKAAREVANLCCDRWQSLTPELLDALLEVLRQRGVGKVFLAQIAQRVFDQTAESKVQGMLEQWLHEALPDPAAQQRQQRIEQTADNLSVSNAVMSLRAIGDADWADVVARISVLMRLMLTSPVFAVEHAATRDQSLHRIERLARRCRQNEVSVARTLLSLMQTSGGPLNSSTPGLASQETPVYWLQGPGRPALLQALGLRPRWMQWPLHASGANLALPLYLGVLLLATLPLLYGLLARQTGLADNPAWWVLAGLLLALPTSEAVVALVNRLISESAQPSLLPRLALASGIPAAHRVLVVIPCMLTSTAGIDTLVHRLRLHHLANPEFQAQFALLSDWADADTAQLDSDAALLAHAVAQIETLNRSHPKALADAADVPRFIVLHRERQFSESEQRWIGWERKRGKLEQLIAALAKGAAPAATSAFIDLGVWSRLAADTPYVVTLDSDTELPPGRLRELVGVAAHPYNQPVLDGGLDGALDRGLDKKRRRVVSGYGILQPRVATPLPAPQERTPYHWLFSGQCGIDPYSAASSEVYQDVFCEGSFSGKGLLHVEAMHHVLGGRLPSGQVLSHDLLEGSMVRCAAVSSITVIEDAPFHADVAASRVHRWTRGDWQLLPFLLQPQKYGLSAIHCWKLFDNLRRSLVAPAALLLLIAAVWGWGLSPGLALALVFAAFTAGPIMGALAGLSPSRDEVAKRHFYKEALRDLARACLGGVWSLSQLLQQAGSGLDAITRALYRMLISRRHLLQWTTASTAQSQAPTTLSGEWRLHAGVSVAALVLGVAFFATQAAHPYWALVLCALWCVSPVGMWWVSRPDSKGVCDVELTADRREQLLAVARGTWRYFEFTVTAADHHLPPDNFQTEPHDMLARRTSPTNMGLYLLSAACARAFGWITTQELLERLEATLNTLQGLQRHRGHLFNWYDTATALPLLPMYVSTVDSGNLCGHLLAVAQSCLELSRDDQEPEHHDRLLAVAQRCELMANQTDFSFLYHPKRHLLHIGYRVAEQQLDASFYDLLASESRLTSLLAIAKGDVPVAHWAALGRPFFAVGAKAGLRSWSGSMFEYLMPSLMLAEPHGSVLREACRAAVLEQIKFARTHLVPWGMSESAYAERDHTLAYQYAPQGVPNLSLRRTPPNELVVAPYATALAAQIDPMAACKNFDALEGLTALGRYGFIDALDFTPARQASDALYTPVSTYMAHHQGMTLVALANVLQGGVAQRWGMANPQVQAVASLLHERVPREVPHLATVSSDALLPAAKRRAPSMQREVTPGASAVQPTHVLSNGRYSVLLRANGAGNSRWGAAGITRFRDDALRDTCGSFLYWRPWEPGRADESAAPALYSLTQHPAPDPQAHHECRFHADRVSFSTRWPQLTAHTTVWVSPEDDIEFRQVELCNRSDRALTLELISAFEITLADPRADEAHPAFSNMFLRCEWRTSQQALVFTRKPRLATERALHAAHFVIHDDKQVLGIKQQTDRQHWQGRNRAPHQPLGQMHALPQALPDGAHPQLNTGLDPVCALAVQLRIEPQGKVLLTFATAASDNGGTLHAVIDKYRQASHVQRASMMSATLAGIRLRSSQLTPEHFAAIQLLTTAVVQSLTRPVHVGIEKRAAPRETVCDRRLLWRFGLSGERPVVLVHVSITEGLGLIRSLARALRLWARGGITCDLVVVNHEVTSYLMPLQLELAALRARHSDDTSGEFSPSGPATTGFYLLRLEELSLRELSTLRALARLHFQADGRPLTRHVDDWVASHEHALEERQLTSTVAAGLGAGGQVFGQVTQGQFAPGSGDFVFDVSTRQRPAKPWINVLANPGFGTQVSEAGGGSTWARNSRLMQLTAWSNDAVADPPCEWLLLQDLATRHTWSVAPSAWGDERIHYRVTHSQGISSIRHRRGELDVTVSWCVDVETSVKQLRLRLINRGPRTQNLRLVGLAEWMMGASRSDRNTVRTSLYSQRLPEVDDLVLQTPLTQKLSALMCTQAEQGSGFGGGTAFFAAVQTADRERSDYAASVDWTCDRREFFDARGRLVLPDHLRQTQGPGLDPCAALAVPLLLKPGDAAEQVFLLGYADSLAAAQTLATRAAAASPLTRLEQVQQQWTRLLGATTVITPDPLFDALVNHWLLYQTLSCRLWAKAAFYQAGGATGFRDQLQDTMALVWSQPQLLRKQIVLCASRQFPEGDVQHWWHEPGGAGVRTHFSDDLLWLPHACAHYLRATADHAVLDEQVAFLDSPPIPEGAEDLYNTPAVSAETASVYEHAARTIDRSLRVGMHGLPLMGSGDWNDGMNRVGIEGQGESVWLGWFISQVVADFGPVARARGDTERAQRWSDAAAGWKAALVGPAWDGLWFKRAFFDNGMALGSHDNAEAKIDLIAQAWSVLSNVAPTAMQSLAMDAVQTRLLDADAGLLRLLDPPLQQAEPSAGYIQAYPPGVRENGGQYNHGAVWALMAQAQLAVTLPTPQAASTTVADPAPIDPHNLPYRSFTWISPAHRAAHPIQGASYGLEPYAVAADIYSQPPYVGRGGWSWYTGAAGWLHCSAIESIFGLKQNAGTLHFHPCLPTHWPEAELRLKRGKLEMRFVFLRCGADAARTAMQARGADGVDVVLLKPLEVLEWALLVGTNRFVVPLL